MGYEIIKKKDNVFDFKGSEVISYRRTKYKEIDNEVYTNDTVEDVLTDIKALRKNNLSKEFYSTYDFKIIDYSVKLKNHLMSQNYITSYMVQYSENQKANGIIHLYNADFLDYRILDVFSKNNNNRITFQEKWEMILNDGIIDVELFRYGFNNSICYKIKIEDLFRADIKNIDYEIKDLFKKYGNIDLEKGTKEDNLIKYLTKLINYKKQIR